MNKTNQFNLVKNLSSTSKTFVTNETLNNLSANINFKYLQFYNETISFEKKINIIIPSIFTLVIIVGLVGNLFVIIVALNRHMRNSTNILIIGN